MVELLVAIVGALALILAAGVTVTIPLLVSTRRHARTAAAGASVAADELQNDHSSNVRVDLDDKHDEVMRYLRAHGRRLGGIERRLHRVEGRVDVVDERTQPRPPTPVRRRAR